MPKLCRWPTVQHGRGWAGPGGPGAPTATDLDFALHSTVPGRTGVGSRAGGPEGAGARWQDQACIRLTPESNWVSVW